MTKDALWASIGPFSPMDTFSAYTMNAHHKRVSRRRGSVSDRCPSKRCRDKMAARAVYGVHI